MADPVQRLGGAFLATPTGHPSPSHRHPELEFNLVVRGSMRYVVGGCRVDCGPGTLLWLFPGQDHVLVQRSENLQLWLAFFHRPVLRQLRLDGDERILLERDPPGQHCRVLTEADRRALRGLLELVHASIADEVLLQAALGHLALSAWRAYARAPVEVAAADIHPAVAGAARLLAGESDASLVEVAAKTGMSASRLRHLFHEQTGSTLVAYRNRQRLHRFLDRHRPDGNLLESALAAGFGSYAQFHRIFRALMGRSPQAWSRAQA